MKKGGWWRQPARHALAAKGIETGRMKQVQQRAPKKGFLPPKARHTSVNDVPEQTKVEATDRDLAQALEEAGSKDGAFDLLENDQWLSSAADKASKEKGTDILDRGALREAIIQDIRKDPLESTEEE